MKEWHQISCSGGKDSTALAIGMWEKGYQIDEIVAADEGMWWPQAYKVLGQITAITGIPVTIIEPPEDKRFEHLMLDHVLTKGPRKGTRGYGWPGPLNRWCTTFCKARPLDAHLKEKEKEGYRIISYIGIAADEENRAKKEGGTAKIEKRFPLIDWGWTEADCLEYCYGHGIDFGGLYEHFSRLSCWCCPLMGLKDARALYHHYPEKWAELKDLDARCRNNWKGKTSVLDLEERFAAEDAQARLLLEGADDDGR